MPATTMPAAYRARRAEGWRAAAALQWARDDAALAAAEDAGRCSVHLEWDEDYSPEDSSDMPELVADEVDGLTSGRYAVVGVMLRVPSTCPHCAHVIEDADWTAAGAIWGVVVDNSGVLSNDPYVRSIAHDLAREAGII